ncbi:hypothetical protein [Microcoleus sp. herbarium2]|uniref:hypothetical protein n=1 Tax=Microcoleus sp. herbarium2 TaxID=3055433 RepID=UPI002FD27F28
MYICVIWFGGKRAIALTPPNPTRSKHFFIFLWIKRIVGYNGVGEFPVRSRVDRLAPDKIK